MKPTNSVHNVPARQMSQRSMPGRILDLFTNVWLGIFWAGLFFLYCSIGSAMPGVRQHPMLEMTEFEWFHWWPFNVLVVLFCATLVVVTIRRIPLRLVNAGVWTIHSGIIVLCIGSYYYFGTKVEGDTPVFRRHVRIEMLGLDQPAKLLALPGNHTSVAVGPDLWRFQVQNTNSQWPILSEEHRGERAYAVNVLVTPPTGEPFIRQLLAGYPQYTEDVIPGKGRAIKSVGRKLIRENLSLTLEYEPQEYFHVMDSWALFVRQVGETEWVQRPIQGLPRYHERIGSRNQVFTDRHDSIPLHSIDLAVPASEPTDPLASTSVRITGYLRYAHMQRRWRDGGDRLNPVLHVSTWSEHTSLQSHELVAFDRSHNLSENRMIEFRWLDDFAQVNSLPTDSHAILHVAVPEAEAAFDVPITKDTLLGADGPFTPVNGTGFSYRIRRVEDNLVIPNTGRLVSVAMVDIKSPEGQFTRMVADRPGMTRDMQGGGDPHTATAGKPQEADPRIQMTYQPASAPILYAAYPGGLYLVVNGASGRIMGREVEVREVVEVVEGLSVRADALWTHAVAEVKPYVVPSAARQRDAGETFTMIRLEVRTSNAVQAKWLRFNQYVFPSEQYAYSGRFSYIPERFRLTDGTLVEIFFSRQRRKLPFPVALEDFALDTHVGGFTGQPLTIRNYISKLRFLDEGVWTDATPIKVNAPTGYGGYWYFQSMWDKPPPDDPTSGMNYTGLGIGNRNGVHIQLTGCCIAVVGMLFAFYVKPILKRRRYERSCAEMSRSEDEEVDETVAVPTAEAVKV